jgi:hypothetical protein
MVKQSRGKNKNACSMIKNYHTNLSISRKGLFLFFFISIFLSGCEVWNKPEQPAVGDKVLLSAGQSIGQTFVAKYEGLTGIYFHLSPQETGNGVIRLHLRSGPQEVDDLSISSNTLSIEAINAPGYYGFFVPAQNSSNQKYYYAVLEVTGSGAIQVGTAAGNTYLNGALYRSGTSENAQTTFHLSYSRRKAIMGLGQEVITWGGILIIGIFLFILPGWGLLALLWPGWGALKWPEKLGLSGGLSLALYPLLMLWTDIIGLHVGALYAWIPPLAGLGIILWKNRNILRIRSLHPANAIKLNLADITFIGIVFLIVFSRFWVIRSLDMPMWGDSYQHTMIAQLLVDHGGLFTSWQPYAEMTTLTYHFGFHSAVAVFDWITHLDIPKAVLWVGQLLNILAVIVLYPLATKVGRSRWAGVAAVLVAGLLSPMPMYYVNWGRYTQLAGQVILPGAIFLVWVTLERASQTIELPAIPGSNWAKLRRLVPFDIGGSALIWIILGGLGLTHYRILILAILFFVAFFFLQINRTSWRVLLVRIFWMGIGGGLLFLPWFIRMFAGKITLTFAAQMSTPVEALSTFAQQYNAIGDLIYYLPTALWLLLPLSIGWGLWRRERGVAMISLWWFVILLAANPQWLRLPGAGALNNFAVFIAFYIPAGVLIGYVVGQVAGIKINIRKAQKSLELVLLLFAFVLGVWGLTLRLGEFQEMQGVLVTRPDIQAAEWIREKTPTNARFLVNSFFAYGDSSIVGSDGGWWLPLIARRQTTLPPLTYSAERGPRPDYVAWVNKLTEEIQNKGITNTDVLAQLRARGVTYIYVGQRQGRVNYSGPYQLEPDQLAASPNFNLVYHQDLVWVYKIVQ